MYFFSVLQTKMSTFKDSEIWRQRVKQENRAQDRFESLIKRKPFGPRSSARRHSILDLNYRPRRPAAGSSVVRLGNKHIQAAPRQTVPHTSRGRLTSSQSANVVVSSAHGAQSARGAVRGDITWHDNLRPISAFPSRPVHRPTGGAPLVQLNKQPIKDNQPVYARFGVLYNPDAGRIEPPTRLHPRSKLGRQQRQTLMHNFGPTPVFSRYSKVPPHRPSWYNIHSYSVSG